MGSTKNVLPPYHLVTSGTLSASGTSSVVKIPYLDNIGVQINIVAPALTAGTFSVNASLDNVNYVPLGLSGNPSVAGANDTIVISLNQVPYNYITVSYASGTTGTGSYDVYIMAKEIG